MGFIVTQGNCRDIHTCPLGSHRADCRAAAVLGKSVLFCCLLFFMTVVLCTCAVLCLRPSVCAGDDAGGRGAHPCASQSAVQQALREVRAATYWAKYLHQQRLVALHGVYE